MPGSGSPGSSARGPEDVPDTSLDASPTIKVDGEVIEVTQSEIDEAGGVASLQKEKAAANRLRLAAQEKINNEQTERNLAERERNIAQREADLAAQAQPAAQPNTQKPPVQDADANLEATAKALAEKIYSGEEDQAEEAILAILQRNAASGQPTTEIDIASVTKQVTAEVSWGLEKKQAQTDFARDFPKLDKMSKR